MPTSRKTQPLRRSRWRWLATATTATMMTTTVHARVHHLFAATLARSPRLYALAFNDATREMAITANLTADATHARIALDAGRGNVYGVSLDKAAVASYEVLVVTNSTATINEERENGYGDEDGVGTTPTNVTLTFRTSVAAAGACLNRTAAFVLPHPLFARVYTASWPGAEACAMALSTTTTPADGSGKGGVLEEVVQSWHYDNKYASGRIAGLALDPEGMTIYSADLDGEALWAHAISPDGTGRVVGLRGRYDLLQPSEQQGHDQDQQGRQGERAELVPPQGPRHLVVHPNGRVLYVVMEAANVVAAYSLDEATRLPLAGISRHSLLPEGADLVNYRGAEAVLSFPSSSDGKAMPKYLWAAAAPSHNATERDPQAGGFISVFGLAADTGEVSGAPLFRVPTMTRTNAIAPAPWSEDWAAVADAGTGYIEMWHIEETQSDDNTTTKTARGVARVDIPDGGCCGNVIWYD